MRPADEGSMRLPYSAKKMALISSDLPREKFSDKGNIEPIIPQTLKKLRQAQFYLGVRKFVFRQPVFELTNR